MVTQGGEAVYEQLYMKGLSPLSKAERRAIYKRVADILGQYHLMKKRLCSLELAKKQALVIEEETEEIEQKIEFTRLQIAKVENSLNALTALQRDILLKKYDTAETPTDTRLRIEMSLSKKVYEKEKKCAVFRFAEAYPVEV